MEEPKSVDRPYGINTCWTLHKLGDKTFVALDGQRYQKQKNGELRRYPPKKKKKK